MGMNEHLLHFLANFDQQDSVKNKLPLMNYVAVVMVLRVDL
jgi:hypothetical protein